MVALRAAQQTCIRDFLLRLLCSLDLQDAGTRKLLSVPVKHIQTLLHTVDLMSVTASEQWTRLGDMLGLTGRPDSNPRKIRKHRDDDARLTVRDGSFTPNWDVQRLPSVFRRDVATILHCASCGEQITSNWYVRLGGSLRVLTPLNGHRKCQGPASPFVPIDGSKFIKDIKFFCDICCHGKRRSECVQCGGSDICEHGKVKRKCKPCREAGRVRSAPGRPPKKVKQIL